MKGDDMGKNLQWFLGILITLMTSFSGGTLIMMYNLNKVLLETSIVNANEHSELKSMIEKESSFTRPVYQYEIMPNTTFRIKWDAILRKEDFGGVNGKG